MRVQVEIDICDQWVNGCGWVLVGVVLVQQEVRERNTGG